MSKWKPQWKLFCPIHQEEMQFLKTDSYFSQQNGMVQRFTFRRTKVCLSCHRAAAEKVMLEHLRFITSEEAKEQHPFEPPWPTFNRAYTTLRAYYKKRTSGLRRGLQGHSISEKPNEQDREYKGKARL
jgi:hypothetical protein